MRLSHEVVRWVELFFLFCESVFAQLLASPIAGSQKATIGGGLFWGVILQ